MAFDIGIDLGTASILVYVKGKGVVLKEPSVVAFDRDTNRIKAIGEEARLMLGRTPGNIVAVRPLRQGVISDYTVTEKMLKYFIQKAVGKQRFRKPLISICVPSQVTEVERKAVEDAAFQAGARDVKIIEEPIAAAIGAGFIRFVNVTVAVISICCAATAAVEFGKAVPTLLFCIYITQFKCIAHIRIYNTVIYISQAKLFFTHELMTRIQIAPRCNR